MHQSHSFDEALLPFPSLEAALAPRVIAEPGPIGRALTALRAWHERRQARFQLAELDQHLLKDIGLTRDARRVDWMV